MKTTIKEKPSLLIILLLIFWRIRDALRSILLALAILFGMSSCMTLLYPGITDHGSPLLPPYDPSIESDTSFSTSFGIGSGSLRYGSLPMLGEYKLVNWVEGGAAYQWQDIKGGNCGSLSLGANWGNADAGLLLSQSEPDPEREFIGMSASLRLGIPFALSPTLLYVPSLQVTYHREFGPWAQLRPSLERGTAYDYPFELVSHRVENFSTKPDSFFIRLAVLDLSFTTMTAPYRLSAEIEWSSLWFDYYSSHGNYGLIFLKPSPLTELIPFVQPSGLFVRGSFPLNDRGFFCGLSLGISRCGYEYIQPTASLGLGMRFI